jgi:RNA polymerase sigma-70 factor (ECF subfamily)
MIPSTHDTDHEDRSSRAKELAAAASSGDREAFGELYRMYYGEVFAFVFRRATSRQLAEDIVSETFVRALRAMDGFVTIAGGFGGWVITIARHLLADHYKSLCHQRERPSSERLPLDQVTVSAEDIVLEQMAYEAVRIAVGNLNPLQQACIRARFLDELSVTETAEQLERMEHAVKALQHRATKALAKDAQLKAALVA